MVEQRWAQTNGVTIRHWAAPKEVIAESGRLCGIRLAETTLDGGKLVETFANLNTVTDLLLDGSKLYAVQLTIFTDQGPGPGSVVTVDANGATPVAEGLISPFGIAKGPDGALYVSYGTVAFSPGMTGGVIKLKQ